MSACDTHSVPTTLYVLLLCVLRCCSKDSGAIRNDLELWRLFTPIFLHAGILHLAGNMFFQLRFGYVLEDRWNWKRFSFIYIAAGVMASLWSAVLAFKTVSVGASGALAGLLGADITYIAYNWVSSAARHKAASQCHCDTNKHVQHALLAHTSIGDTGTQKGQRICLCNSVCIRDSHVDSHSYALWHGLCLFRCVRVSCLLPCCDRLRFHTADR